MTSVTATDVEAPVVLLLLRLFGDVLRAPLGVVKTTVCFMAVHGVVNDDGGGFWSSNSGDAPAMSTSSLVERLKSKNTGG